MAHIQDCFDVLRRLVVTQSQESEIASHTALYYFPLIPDEVAGKISLIGLPSRRKRFATGNSLEQSPAVLLQGRANHQRRPSKGAVHHSRSYQELPLLLSMLS